MKSFVHALAALTLTAAVLAAPARASDQKNKAQTGPVVTISQNPLIARPDFVVVITPDGSMILDNIGDADFRGTVGLDVTCKVLSGGAIKPVIIGQGAPSRPVATCGSEFTDGKLHQNFDNFPKGHGVKQIAPIEPPAGTSMYQDGRIVIHLKMPAGTYEMTAKADPANKIIEKDETNNSAGPTTATVK